MDWFLYDRDLHGVDVRRFRLNPFHANVPFLYPLKPIFMEYLREICKGNIYIRGGQNKVLIFVVWDPSKVKKFSFSLILEHVIKADIFSYLKM